MDGNYTGMLTTFYRIDIHFVIKIADFGLSEDVYVKNYFRQSGSDKSVKLPVKWMAPESLSDGVFSEKSDMVYTNICLSYTFIKLEHSRAHILHIASCILHLSAYS